MSDMDLDKYLEQGLISVDQATLLTVVAMAERHHATVPEMAAELIHDGIAARATRATKDHECKRGQLNPRFCAICSAPM
ncbi:hypothetical protein FPZ12_029490 [Amycolatopsis acidicola]|uniref:Uncharacterized protein n=1 Tax=Amycolatopsis acidicola TaxID=2596893 RepID=A0A5N0UWU7_9PSEU|nr:hypothetical protein [Amycolatopsis acidicola]KAA9155531.1 hypothetical protein FPZ12_029490 [Amycolatopsis acidicola]